MKKFYYHFAVALLAVLAMTTFTSCESDEQIAYDLSGEWEGYMGESYYDHWGYENYAEYYTVMRFYREGRSDYRYGATKGEGEQIDYVNGSRYRPYYRYFTWEVDWGTIYLYYDNGEQVRIYNYTINGRRFTGTMKYYDRWNRELSVADFDFSKTTNFDWDYYYEWSQQPAAMKNDSIIITK